MHCALQAPLSTFFVVLWMQAHDGNGKMEDVSPFLLLFASPWGCKSPQIMRHLLSHSQKKFFSSIPRIVRQQQSHFHRRRPLSHPFFPNRAFSATEHFRYSATEHFRFYDTCCRILSQGKKGTGMQTRTPVYR